MSRLKNMNIPVVRRAARLYGGSVDRIERKSSHVIVVLKTSEGEEKRMQVSHYKVNDFILRGWVRQALTRPTRPR